VRYAETWLDVGRLPLRRSDRLSLAFALECCRRGYDLDVEATFCSGGPVATDINYAWGRAQRCGEVPLARLALLLRVLLRVNDGTGTLVSGCRKQRRGMPCTCWDGRVRPLWEAAR
jgi:hypothetical protein